MALTINTNIVNDADNYTADAKQIKGGYVSVATIAERDGLPAATVMTGSLCYVAADGKIYQYNGSAWVEKSFCTSALIITASNVTATTFDVDKTIADVTEAITNNKLVILNITTLDGNCYTLRLTQYKSTYIALNFESSVLGNSAVFQLSAIDETTYEGTISTKQLNTVSVSDTGTASDEIHYITIDDVEKKLPSGITSFNDLTNRPSYNGTAMTNATNIPEVKTSTWDGKQDALPTVTNDRYLHTNSSSGALEWSEVDQDIFVIDYQQSGITNTIIYNAWSAGKAVFCRYLSRVCSLTLISANAARFNYITEDKVVGGCYIANGSNWGTFTSKTLAEQSEVTLNTQARHKHDNKSTLDQLEGYVDATTLDVDSTVTSGSSNLITSGAVYTSVSGKADSSTLTSHTSNKSNPHSVTKSQIGLGSVDNTSDATKKSNFKGSIASGNTGFVTGGDAYTAINAKSVVSGTNDGTNWTNITINGTTKAIPSGGGGGGSSVKEQVYTYIYNPDDSAIIDVAIQNGKHHCIETVLDDAYIRGQEPRVNLTGITDATYTAETDVDLYCTQDEDYSGNGVSFETTLTNGALMKTVNYRSGVGDVTCSSEYSTRISASTGDPQGNSFGICSLKFRMLYNKRVIFIERWLS